MSVVGMKQRKERVYISLGSAHGPCHVHATKLIGRQPITPGPPQPQPSTQLPPPPPCHNEDNDNDND